MAADNETGIIWIMRWMCQSKRNRIIYRAYYYVFVLAAICAARWQFRNILLDPFALCSVLGIARVPWAEFLEMVYHSLYHLHG